MYPYRRLYRKRRSRLNRSSKRSDGTNALSLNRIAPIGLNFIPLRDKTGNHEICVKFLMKTSSTKFVSSFLMKTSSSVVCKKPSYSTAFPYPSFNAAISKENSTSKFEKGSLSFARVVRAAMRPSQQSIQRSHCRLLLKETHNQIQSGPSIINVLYVLVITFAIRVFSVVPQTPAE